MYLVIGNNINRQIAKLYHYCLLIEGTYTTKPSQPSNVKSESTELAWILTAVHEVRCAKSATKFVSEHEDCRLDSLNWGLHD